MDLARSYVDLTNVILDMTGLTHPMAHLHGGLAIYVLMQFALRTRRASAIALQAVFGAEIINEIVQRGYYGSWRWEDSIADVLITVTWPTILYGLGKFRRTRWTAANSPATWRRSAPRPATHIALASAPERSGRQ